MGMDEVGTAEVGMTEVGTYRFVTGIQIVLYALSLTD